MTTFTHQELWQAVRETAEGREFFTSADVRKHLGVSTRDKAKLNAFHTGFRGFLKAAAADLESAGKNRYRIAGQVASAAGDATPSEAATLIADAIRAAVAEAPAAVAHAAVAPQAVSLHEAVAEVIEAPAHVAVVMVEVSDSAAIAGVIDAPVSHDLVAPSAGKVRGELRVLPAFAARVVHEVTQRPVVKRWRDRAQRISRRVVQLFNGIGIGTRTAA
jgi:hypothetical protein